MALIEELKTQGEFLFKYRSYLPLFLLIAGVSVKVYLTIQNIGEMVPGYQKYLIDSALAVGVFGLVVRAITVGYTPKNTSGRNTAEGQVADTLNTTGFYTIVRNPLYLGNYLMWLAIAMLTGSIWFVIMFSLVFWIYYERIVFAEESFLRNKFGEIYLKWAAVTPPFIPNGLRWQKPAFPFSWKKVMKKEKNGLFALFLVFYAFEVLEKSVVSQKVILPQSWMMYAAIISGVIYFILKFIKQGTRLLEEEDR